MTVQGSSGPCASLYLERRQPLAQWELGGGGAYPRAKLSRQDRALIFKSAG